MVVKGLGGVSGDMFSGSVGKLATVGKFGIAIAIAGGILFFVMQSLKYNTKVIILKQRSGGTDYVFSRAKKNLAKGVFTVKTNGMFGKTKNLPLPPSDDLIAKTGKNDLIVVRELPNGELRYCTHPDVKSVTFKTLSTDYREFDLIDAEETKKRHGSTDWWKEHGAQIMMAGFIVLIFVLAIILLQKFDDVVAAAGSVANNLGELSKQKL